MKKILIMIHNMEIGGAQKSLLSFCQTLAAAEVSGEYEVHLMPVNPTGTFISQLPEYIKLINPPKELRWVGSPLSKELLMKNFSLRCLFGEMLWILRSLLKLFPETWNLQQKLWACWRKIVPDLKEQYDIAISYMDGVPNYYVSEKVHAAKKTLWFHSEYQKQGYYAEYDQKYYEKCDSIVTISEKCRECLLIEFPQYEKKIHVLENITSEQMLDKFSLMFYPKEYLEKKCLKILSVGRLNYQKGFDLAIQAAKELKESGVDFLWCIVGEGTERDMLQNMLEKDELSDRVQLIGAKENPYPYIRQCDILVQPSRCEGKSIVLDEAKILCKPIVATNYTTVSASIEHGVSGWIVEMSPHGIAQGIKTLYEHPELCERLVGNLQAQTKGNEDELQKYIELML